MRQKTRNTPPTGHASERPSVRARASGMGEVSWYNAKYSALQENQCLQPVSHWATVDPETGECLPFVQEGTDLKKRIDPKETRLERFALQSAARRLLWGSRTAKCLRLRRADKTAVEVWRSADHGSAHYGGLQTCGSVWSCPVCSAKISEKRRLALLATMEQHRAGGGEVLLLTLTNPHTRNDDLAEMLQFQANALDIMNRNKSGRKLWDSIGCVGTVRATEVTVSQENGWHPHYHLLLFVPSGLNLTRLRRRFYVEWAKACRKSGLPLPAYRVVYMQNGKRRFFYGVDVQDGSKASAYVTKGQWGLEHEMTKGHIKKSSRGRSPFDLLRSYLYDEDKQAGALFVEYAKAFKGKRQLVYSNGLKKLYTVDTASDQELAIVQEENADLLGLIELDQWRLILAADVRGEVLELARHGWEAVTRLLASLESQDKKPKREKDT